MADETGALNAAVLLRSTAIFRELSNDQLDEIWSRAKVHNLLRGEILVRQHSPSDSVYVVVSGRFEVWVEGQPSPINEIGVGEPIGETGFFSGATRNATIVAARDSVVLELDRASFDERRARKCRRSIRRCCAHWRAGSPTAACGGPPRNDAASPRAPSR